MPKRSSRPSKAKDLNQLAAGIVEAATKDPPPGPGKPPTEVAQKNRHAVALGQLGGKKGGLERAKKLSADRRREIAQQAARARWSKRGNA